MTNGKYRLGCIPDLPDQRDLKFSLATPKVFPPRVDLSPNMPPIYDQGSLGSCTANAIAAVFEHEIMQRGIKPWMPSRLMLYYLEREMEGTIESDAGAYIRDGLKVMAGTGVCKETLWPYIVSKFKEKPTNQCYQNAKKLHHKALKYRRVSNSIQDIKTSLVHKNPIVIGFAVYQSFYSIGKNGMMPMPRQNERVEGGHAVVGVGYEDDIQCVKARNSWDEPWGDKGHFYMPYSFIQDPNYSFDFWNISRV